MNPKTEIISTGGGFTAFQLVDPIERPDHVVQVTTDAGCYAPNDLEKDDLLLVVLDRRTGEEVGQIELTGRAALNQWYSDQVGQQPDVSDNGPLPIQELFEQVAHQFLLHNAPKSHHAIVQSNQIHTDAIQALVKQCGDDLWGECAQFPKQDWKHEVESDDTILGYWEWVYSQAESNGIPLESLNGQQ